jgi:hypothetical protein
MFSRHTAASHDQRPLVAAVGAYASFRFRPAPAKRFADTAWRRPMTAHVGAEAADRLASIPGATDGDPGHQQYNESRGGYDPVRINAHCSRGAAGHRSHLTPSRSSCTLPRDPAPVRPSRS